MQTIDFGANSSVIDPAAAPLLALGKVALAIGEAAERQCMATGSLPGVPVPIQRFTELGATHVGISKKGRTLTVLFPIEMEGMSAAHWQGMLWVRDNGVFLIGRLVDEWLLVYLPVHPGLFGLLEDLPPFFPAALGVMKPSPSGPGEFEQTAELWAGLSGCGSFPEAITLLQDLFSPADDGEPSLTSQETLWQSPSSSASLDDNS